MELGDFFIPSRSRLPPQGVVERSCMRGRVSSDGGVLHHKHAAGRVAMGLPSCLVGECIYFLGLLMGDNTNIIINVLIMYKVSEIYI